MNICNHPEAAGCTAVAGGSPPTAPTGGSGPVVVTSTARPSTTTTASQWSGDNGQWDKGDNGDYDNGQWDNSGQWKPSTTKPTTIRPPGPTQAVPLQVQKRRQWGRRGGGVMLPSIHYHGLQHSTYTPIVHVNWAQLTFHQRHWDRLRSLSPPLPVY
jgi:hypothetical protein